MMFSKISVLAAATTFSVVTHAHMMIKTPTPYGKSTLNNSPLVADGSDFPCKQRPGVYDDQGAQNDFPLGSSQELSFIGSAVHGGGSCQLSITYDLQPSKTSTFKVIDSIEGGCPASTAGNLPDDPTGSGASTFKYTIPSGLPSGNATLAWTWFNKIGNREMYMNCAPVSLSGGSSKRATANAFYDGLPNMFVANIGNGCKTVDSADLLFPDPGSVVQKAGSSPLTPPTGTCPGGTGSSSSSSGGSAGGSAAAPSAGSSGDSSSASTGASPTSPSGGASSGGAAAGSGSTGGTVGSGTGGVFAPAGAASGTGTGASASPTSAAGSASTGAAGAGAGAGTGASTGGNGSAAVPAPGAAGSSGASSGAGAPSTGGSTASSTGTCSTSQLGQILCNGATQFGTCDNGGRIVWMAVAAGTECQNGNIVAARKIKNRRVVARAFNA
ncbi:MAG: hypothetical protein M1838_000579 [Thelocarpon superellum]|nr:MAG: hypothetical protein M1838_000579 [Thelocarpon superellum]